MTKLQKRLDWTLLIRALVMTLGNFEPVFAGVSAQTSSETIRRSGDSVNVRLVDVDLRAAIEALSKYADRPVIFGNLPATHVTLQTPAPIAREQVLSLLRSLLETQNLELVTDTLSRTYRVGFRPTLAGSEVVRPAGRGQGSTQDLEFFTIHLRHAKALDVASTINALYGRASAIGEGNVIGAGSTLSQQLSVNQLPPVNSNTPVPSAGSAPQGRLGLPSGEMIVVPDARTNSLLVRSNAADFELITAAVRQLDVRAPQVLIDVLIAEVRKDRSFSFGVDATVPDQKIGQKQTITIGGSQTGLGLGDFAIHVMKSGGTSFEATLRAAAARGEARILSRPVVLASNNETAEILVGSQRPFVQVSRTLPTETAVRDQIVQYKDVGTRLLVHVFVSDDDYVSLEITQEVNAATTETEFDAPVISTRSVRTRLTVHDSQTIVLGGLTDKQRERTQTGIPILVNIPLLGGLFGSASWTTTETEFFLFLTPRVVRSDEDVDSLTDPFRHKAETRRP